MRFGRIEAYAKAIVVAHALATWSRDASSTLAIVVSWPFRWAARRFDRVAKYLEGM